MKTNKILIGAGGGAKGYMQIHTLKKLEYEAHKPLCEDYDLLAGTSVGAINMGIVASGQVTMDKFLRLYPSMCKEIFKKRFFGLIPRYSKKPFYRIFNDLIGSEFRLGDCKTKLMITSVDLVKDQNKFFKSWHEDDANEKLVDILCRSFAAPYYFGQINDKKHQCVWSDGGIGSSNFPLDEVKLQAEAMKMYYNVPLLIDALGTGFIINNNTYKKVSRGNVLKQIGDFVKLKDGGMARSQSREDQIKRMVYIAKKVSNIRFRYWDIDINKKIDGLDKIKYLKEYGEYGIMIAQKPLIDIGGYNGK